VVNNTTTTRAAVLKPLTTSSAESLTYSILCATLVAWEHLLHVTTPLPNTTAHSTLNINFLLAN